MIKRVELKQKLADTTARHEARLDHLRKPDGSIDTSHPDYGKVKGEWEADMAALRSDPKYADGPDRMGRHDNAAAEINGEFGENAITLTGSSSPKTCLPTST